MCMVRQALTAETTQSIHQEPDVKVGYSEPW
jgi:hypothetical protein